MRIALLALALLAGCAGFVPQPGPPADPPGQYQTLTRPLIALGDTQEHESTGYPLIDNDSAVDAFVEVAQRPPEQPLFGRRILQWVLDKHPDEPFLHLGDVMDLSCRSEAQRLTRILAEAGRSGAILPGNHDGLMFGIYGYNILDAVLDPNAQRWNRACRRGAGPDEKQHKTPNEALSKREFIALYLGLQARLPDAAPQLPSLPARGDHQLSWRNPNPEAFLSAIEARVQDGTRYSDSFVAQRLLLPAAKGAKRRVVILGLDTNQAGALVSAWDTVRGRSPGSVGHVHPDQFAAVRPWVLEAARRGDIVVFAGHHNWVSLGLPSRILLRQLMSELDHPLIYLSAHTHRGFWAEHRALDRRPVLELNVSSLSDWPIAYRRLEFAYDETQRRLLLRGELMPKGALPTDNDAALLAAWQEQACAPLGPGWPDFVAVDRGLVERQRAARGSLVEWLVANFSAVCESCERPLYDHALAYQDALLDALLQLDRHLGDEAHGLQRVKLPDWCGAQDFRACSSALRAEQPQGLAAEVDSFRRKAQLVDVLSNHLDDLRSPRAQSYMSCRAVHAARIDFELTPEHRNNHRGEAHRRAEQFFRVEASVGME